MLKIKNNIELKELEKFGFCYDDEKGHYLFCERNISGISYIKINTWNRKIFMRKDREQDKLVLTVLYDLIQAGLVEKVEE